jgi:hypothetical protein
MQKSETSACAGKAMTIEQQDDLSRRLRQIEMLLQVLVEQHTVKEWYSTAEVAKILGKAEFTVREWCRLRRVNAEKRDSGRGLSLEWIISHQELTRIRNDGLLPLSDKW